MNRTPKSRAVIKEAGNEKKPALITANPKKKRTVQSKANLPEKFSYDDVDDKNILAIIEHIRKGISYPEFISIADTTPFSITEWANFLQVSERTIQRNQKENKPFPPIQSERIIEINLLYVYGTEVFGDASNFNTWLYTKSIALGGRKPKDLLDTKFGISMVKDELGRIEHGILA